MTKNYFIIPSILLSLILVAVCSGFSSEETPESEPASFVEIEVGD